MGVRVTLPNREPKVWKKAYKLSLLSVSPVISRASPNLSLHAGFSSFPGLSVASAFLRHAQQKLGFSLSKLVHFVI
jgi:hypothetical protein